MGHENTQKQQKTKTVTEFKGHCVVSAEEFKLRILEIHNINAVITQT